MNPYEALARHRIKIREAAGRFPVTNPRVFGSVARGHDQSNSDLDILVRRQIQQQKPGIISGRPLWMRSRARNWSLIRQ
jgi:predicted nucleotidyltransferase